MSVNGTRNRRTSVCEMLLPARYLASPPPSQAGPLGVTSLPCPQSVQPRQAVELEARWPGVGDRGAGQRQ